MYVYTANEFMKNSKNMHIFKCDVASNASDYTIHTHDFIEIVYVLSGKTTHVINSQRYEAKKGDLLFMNYGCTHQLFSDVEYSYINILFSPEVMSENIVTPENAFSVLSLTAFNEICNDTSFGRISFSGDEQKEIEAIILDMLKEYTEQNTSWQTIMGNHLSTLMIKILRKTALGIETQELGHIWQELSEYIDSNLGSHLTLSDLAQKCFYNPSYFNRIFKEKFGVTPMKYITQKRLDYAAELLRKSRLSITEISQNAGFADRNSFYHAFSRHFGVTPAQYRNKK